MKLFLRSVSAVLVFQLGMSPLLAQPIITQPTPIQPQMGNGVANLRVGNLSQDGTEVILTMDSSYDGFGGRSAKIIPIIQKKDQQQVSGWFGADPVTIGPGRGMISIKVKYFNDEASAPGQLTTDRVRVLILNQSETVVISSIPFLKTIKWGRADAETETERLVKERQKDQAETQARRDAIPAFAPIASDLKTRITNVDVVNRSLDRTQMTIGVEFEYKDNIGAKPMLGVDIIKTSEPSATRYFQSKPAEIGKSRRNFLLFPVKYQPPQTSAEYSSFSTDKVMVFLQEAESGRRYNVFPVTMLLMWHLPDADVQAATSITVGSTVELDDFKQNEPHAGYLTLRYHLADGSGRLRARIFDSTNPESAKWFDASFANITAGRGFQVLDISVRSQAPAHNNLVRTDTIEIELVDRQGQILSRVQKQLPMIWAKPPE